MMTKLLLIDERGTLDPRVEAALTRRYELLRVPDGEVPDPTGLELVILVAGSASSATLERLWATGLADRTVVLGNNPSLAQAMDAIRAHVRDFVPNGADSTEVLGRVAHVLERIDLDRGLKRTPAESARVDDAEMEFPSLVMRDVCGQLARVAPTDVGVWIRGERGVGKKWAARLLHKVSHRAHQPFVVFDARELPRGALLPTLYGSVGGALPAALGHQRGLLAEASEGTLLWEEPSSTPLDVQASLAGVLRRQRFQPYGYWHDVPLTARVVAVSSLDLQAEVARGALREDLYRCLSMVQLTMPPLRARGTDILLLAQDFIAKAQSEVVGITADAARVLLGHSWPGNVRELLHCVTAAISAARLDHLTTADLPQWLRPSGSGTYRKLSAGDRLRDLELAHILDVLASSRGNKTLASRRLGFDRRTLYRKLKAYEAEAEGKRTG